MSLDQIQKGSDGPRNGLESVVMVKNPNRKSGQIPKILLPTLENDAPQKHRGSAELMLQFWVNRKDLLFADYQWPLVVEMYRIRKKEVIVRVNVCEGHVE